MVCKRILVHGKVQGVFFRASTKEKAEELGLTGEVRNLPDGGVEVVACGDAAQVERLVGWCRVGPPRARVDEVVVNEVEEQRFEGFRVVRR